MPILPSWSSNAKRAELVVDLYNLVFESSPRSDAFWAGASDGLLAAAMRRKFGVRIATKESAMRDLHMPQLFAAMLYHIGTRVQLSLYNNITTTGLREPLRLEGECRSA